MLKNLFSFPPPRALSGSALACDIVIWTILTALQKKLLTCCALWPVMLHFLYFEYFSKCTSSQQKRRKDDDLNVALSLKGSTYWWKITEVLFLKPCFLLKASNSSMLLLHWYWSTYLKMAFNFNIYLCPWFKLEVEKMYILLKHFFAWIDENVQLFVYDQQGLFAYNPSTAG